MVLGGLDKVWEGKGWEWGIVCWPEILLGDWIKCGKRRDGSGESCVGSRLC